MSGGYFDYSHFQVEMLAEDIQRFVDKQRRYKGGESRDEQNGGWDHQFSDETLGKIEHAAKMLRHAANMAHKVDYLISGDIDEKSFHEEMDSLVK